MFKYVVSQIAPTISRASQCSPHILDSYRRDSHETSPILLEWTEGAIRIQIMDRLGRFRPDPGREITRQFHGTSHRRHHRRRRPDSRALLGAGLALSLDIKQGCADKVQPRGSCRVKATYFTLGFRPEEDPVVPFGRDHKQVASPKRSREPVSANRYKKVGDLKAIWQELGYTFSHKTPRVRI